MRCFKISILLMTTIIIFSLNNSFSFAFSEENIEATKDTITYTYKMSEEEENEFLANLQDEITYNKTKASILDKKRTGGNTTLTTIRDKTETIILDNNSIDYVLSKISPSIDYSEDGFKGTLTLDTTNLTINEIKGASHEYKVSLVKKFENYNRNDLDKIPKTIKQNGITYYLTSPSWDITSTDVIDNKEYPSNYTANMLYEGIAYKIDPSTYEITYTYTGNVEKTEENPLIYTVIYKKDKNIIPALLSGGGIFFIIIFILVSKKHIIIYNKQDNCF